MGDSLGKMIICIYEIYIRPLNILAERGIYTLSVKSVMVSPELHPSKESDHLVFSSPFNQMLLKRTLLNIGLK